MVSAQVTIASQFPSTTSASKNTVELIARARLTNPPMAKHCDQMSAVLQRSGPLVRPGENDGE
jgi:hypothetical protein